MLSSQLMKIVPLHRLTYRSRRKTLLPLTKMQRLCKVSCAVTIHWPLKMTDVEKEKIISPLKTMNENEVINDLLKLLDQVQKHALLQSPFEH